MHSTFHVKKMLIKTGVKLFLAFFISFFSCRFLLNYFLTDIPNTFFNPASHLIPVNYYFLKPLLPTFVLTWVLAGITLLWHFEKKWLRFLFFVLSYIYIGYLNQIVLPLRSEYFPILFLALLLLTNTEPKNSDEVLTNKILIFFGKFFWVLLYVGAGVYKLYHVGFAWPQVETLRYFIFYQNQYGLCQSLPWLSELIYSHETLLRVIMISTLTFELAYPLIFLKRFTKTYLFLTVVFHLGAIVVLDTVFIAHLGAIIFWYLKSDSEPELNSHSVTSEPHGT